MDVMGLLFIIVGILLFIFAWPIAVGLVVIGIPLLLILSFLGVISSPFYFLSGQAKRDREEAERKKKKREEEQRRLLEQEEKERREGRLY